MRPLWFAILAQCGTAVLPSSTVAQIITGNSNGAVKVFEQMTYTELSSLFPYGTGLRPLVSVAGGHLNGDGIPDLITCADGLFQGQVKVFDGLAGNQLQSFVPYPGFTGVSRSPADT